MKTAIEIRPSGPQDVDALMALYPAAFPEEDLLTVVRALLGAETGVLSLVACLDANLVGHVAFTECSVPGRSERVSMLAPLAVAPAHQRAGIGRTLTGEGLRLLKEDGFAAVYVLGDPNYYGRLGFSTEARVNPPYPLPEEWRGAWQSPGACRNRTSA